MRTMSVPITRSWRCETSSAEGTPDRDTPLESAPCATNDLSKAIELAPTTVVSASKPLKQQGFVSRQADIGDALNEHNICSPTTRGPDAVRFVRWLGCPRAGHLV